MAASSDHPKLKGQNEYGRYSIPHGLENRPAVRKILAGQVYEADTIRFIQANVGTGDVIHAGTFFGDFLPALSKAIAPDAQIWAFEPNPVNYRAARETIALNDLTNVSLTNAALAMTGSHVSFRTHSDAGESLGGLSHVTAASGEGIVDVQSVMLDFAVPLERPVSILHLDVEGFEKFALRGAYHIINRWTPVLIVELFDKPQFIQRHFRAVDYVQLGEINGNFIYVPKQLPAQLPAKLTIDQTRLGQAGGENRL